MAEAAAGVAAGQEGGAVEGVCVKTLLSLKALQPKQHPGGQLSAGIVSSLPPLKATSKEQQHNCSLRRYLPRHISGGASTPRLRSKSCPGPGVQRQSQPSSI